MILKKTPDILVSQKCNLVQPKYNIKKENTNSEIQKLLHKAVIVEFEREPNDFVSAVFTREKKDGFCRTILN